MGRAQTTSTSKLPRVKTSTKVKVKRQPAAVDLIASKKRTGSDRNDFWRDVKASLVKRGLTKANAEERVAAVVKQLQAAGVLDDAYHRNPADLAESLAKR